MRACSQDARSLAHVRARGAREVWPHSQTVGKALRDLSPRDLFHTQSLIIVTLLYLMNFQATLNNYETPNAIRGFGISGWTPYVQSNPPIAIDIAIAKAIFQLLLLILLREFSNYSYCYLYC